KPVQVFLDAEASRRWFRVPAGGPHGRGRQPEDALLLGGWPGPGGAGVRRLPGPAGRSPGLRPVPLRRLREETAEADEEGREAEEARGPPTRQRRERLVLHPRLRVLPRVLQRAQGGGPTPGLHLGRRERLRL